VQKKFIYPGIGIGIFIVLVFLFLFFIGTKSGNGSFAQKIGLDNSPYEKRVLFLKEESSKAGGYFVLKVKTENSTAITLSGWTLKVGGEEKIIPLGSPLPYFGEVNQLSAIKLLPGDTVIISFSPSPLGVAFKENKCSGYLEEFLTFTPVLPKECPSPVVASGETACQGFIENLPICQTKIENSPSAECKRFVSDNVGYNACITKHKNDADFFSKTWRVYVPLSSPLKGPLTLLDGTGKKVLDINF
jgi:hypothetical protein